MGKKRMKGKFYSEMFIVSLGKTCKWKCRGERQLYGSEGEKSELG